MDRAAATVPTTTRGGHRRRFRPAGKALRAISLALTRIRTREQAAAWEIRLHEWHQVYGQLINTKTFLKDADTRLAWTPGVLFTYLDDEFEPLAISSTTNWIDGGCNHPIKDLLRRHRGMSDEHRRRATE